MKTRAGAALTIDQEVEGLRQAATRLQRTLESLRASLKTGTFSRLVWQTTTNRVAALLEAHTGWQEPEVAEVLDEIDIIGNEVLALGDLAAPAAEAAPAKEVREVVPASQFKARLPPFSGKPDDLEGWKATLITRMRAAGVDDLENMFAVISDGYLLPEALRPLVRNERTWGDFWDRLHRAIPARVVRLSIAEHLVGLEQLGESNSRDVVTGFQLRLEDFIARCVERGWDADLAARFTVEFVLGRMGPTVREKFCNWEDLRQLDQHTTDLKRLRDFMESYLSALPIEAGKDAKPAKEDRTKDDEGRKGKDNKKWSKPWPKDGEKSGGEPAKPQGAAAPMASAAEGAKQKDAEPQKRPETNVRVHAAGVAAQGDPVLRPVTWVVVRADKRRSKWVALRCLIDEGCEVSFISTEAARKLGFAPAEGGVALTLSYFGGRSQRSGGAPRAVKIKGLGVAGPTYSAVVCELDQLKETQLGVTLPAECPHLKEALPHVPTDDGPLEMILGYDLKGLLLPTRMLVGGRTEPVAVATKVAWMIVPPTPSDDPDQDGEEARNQRIADFMASLKRTEALRARRCIVAHPGPEDAEELTEDGGTGALTKAFQLWAKSDLLGVAPTSRCACSPREIEEADFVHHVRAAMGLKDGRVEVPLPWRHGFPASFENNRNHVATVQRRVMDKVRNNGLTAAYGDEMALILDQYAEPVDPEEVGQPSAWYLIHFPVQNRTKLRIVWNAAQKTHGLALNDGLHKGPVLLNNLMAILYGFRHRRTPVAGDIRKMYNQVQLAPQDRDYHRFIWNGEDFRWKRLVFGDKPAPDVAIAALHFLADRNADQFPVAARLLRRAAYVDDIIFSVDTELDARQAMSDISTILLQGAFEVKKWETSPGLPEEEAVVPVLGVQWDRHRDRLGTRLAPPLPTKWTKRRILSWLASIWDPLGLTAPAAVEAKVRLQAMWDCARGWDDPLPADEAEAWSPTLQRYAECTGVEVDRWIGAGPWDLHVFCDAGRDAYGAVAWAVQGSTRSFISAKSQVAPLKSQTVPRLELMSVLLGMRLAGTWLDSCEPGLASARRVIWTDSVTVQRWVGMPSRRLKAFVAARVAEIHEWQQGHGLVLRRVPTEANPADWLTKHRVRSREHLQEWLEGPMFISEPECRWPPDNAASGDDSAHNDLVGLVTAELRSLRVTTVLEDPVAAVLQAVGGWRRRRRILAWILSWRLQHGRAKVPEAQTLDRSQRELALFDQRQSPPKTPKGLSAFSDEGLLRVKGRLNPASVGERAAHPILLAPGDLAKSMMRDCHATLFHCPARQVLHHVHVEKGVFVVQGRRLAQEVVNQCPTCRRMHQRLHPQPMAPLPDLRQVGGPAPFQSISVDFLETAGRRKNRAKGTPEAGALIMIFVCDATRAVHLELTSSESAESIVKAWIRFSCRRGVWPSAVRSDAGQGLRKAAKTLERWRADWATAIRESTPDGTPPPVFEWSVGVPRVPHRMGVVEALVKSVKRALRTALQATKVETAEDWDTLICRIVFLINGRPCDLAYWADLHQEPVTANDILHPYHNAHPYNDDPAGYRVEAEDTADRFWHCWQAQAPPNLLPRSKWNTKPKEWCVGDLVLIRRLQTGAVQLPRGSWPKGRIVKCHPGEKDGVVRRVTVELASGGTAVVVPHHLILLFRDVPD